METLTSRSEEATFERFARKLAEAEICPNLRPITGPTGGGDGKVDTETYPVGEEVALRWYYGEQAAASERWAFAFSAKKVWAPKVRRDVKSIVDTDRDYKRIIFITNQNARAKDRSRIEDELTKKYGIPVTIHDRNWILDKVFGNNRVALAVRTLAMSSDLERQINVIGSQDYDRIAELSKLDTEIADTSRYHGTPHALAEDCLEGALLARGLGRNRAEVDGRFMQARRAAIGADNKILEFRVVYKWAWTVYFWFDDFSDFADLYGNAATLIEGTENAELLSDLTTLWSLLRKSVTVGGVSPEAAKLTDRGASLRAALSAAASDETRPNNALQAQSSGLFVEMLDRLHERSEESLDDIWERFRALIKDADGLGTFPF